jgi:hypothetical protein
MPMAFIIYAIGNRTTTNVLPVTCYLFKIAEMPKSGEGFQKYYT